MDAQQRPAHQIKWLVALLYQDLFKIGFAPAPGIKALKKNFRIWLDLLHRIAANAGKSSAQAGMAAYQGLERILKRSHIKR